ncbi:MAG: glycosyltransferase family 39 protein [Planctomycetes bacterium]|nr:glycosyltransferase family 39 protein [Planctomycetota bacterium]
MFAAVVRLSTLGAYPLTDTTEARYGEIAREMTVNGDWVMPRVDGGRPFWAKPPLSTWATAASFEAFGVNEFAARLPAVLMVALTAWLTFLVARKLFGRGVALASAAVLVTSGIGFLIAGSVMTDAALGLATTATVAGFILGVEGRGTAAGRNWAYLGFLGIGAGLLAKGPIACVLSFPPIALLLWTTRGRGLVRGIPWVTGSLLALAVSVPWYAAAEARTPGFLRYFLEGEHIRRFIDPHWSGDLYGAPRTKPRGTIWLLALGDALPWAVLAGWALVRERRDVRGMAARLWSSTWGPLLAAWALLPLCFFTVASAVMWTYIWPGMPAVAILVARLLTRGSPEGAPRSPRAFVVAACVLPVAAAIAVPLLRTKLQMTACQQGLVRRFDAEALPGAVLVYAIADVPCSADFYSSGRAVRMGGASPAAWDALLRAHDDVFVVTKPGGADQPPPSVRPTLERVADFDKYRLLRRTRPGAERPK